MKLLAIILLALGSLSIHAKQSAKLSLGILSPQGLVGINYEKILTLNDEYTYAPTVGLGIDPTGLLKTGGMRFYKKNTLDTEKWFNRCLFVFKECEHFYSLSGYVHQVDGGTTTVDKSGNDLEYKTSAGWMSSLAIGTRSIIHEKWIFDFELSQRFLVSGMSTKQVEGANNSSDRQSIEDLSTSLGFSFGFGYLW
jgi:hypothetical protein